MLVVDNQKVKPGELLVKLDDRDQQVNLIAARADLAAANAQLQRAQTQLTLTEKNRRGELAIIPTSQAIRFWCDPREQHGMAAAMFGIALTPRWASR